MCSFHYHLSIIFSISSQWLTQDTYYRADFRLAPSQWETSLQSNAVSHWLGATLESALYYLHCRVRILSSSRIYRCYAEFILGINFFLHLLSFLCPEKVQVVEILSRRWQKIYLTHCVLVIPNDYIEWGQHWLRWRLVAWWHQAITWSNTDGHGLVLVIPEYILNCDFSNSRVESYENCYQECQKQFSKPSVSLVFWR